MKTKLILFTLFIFSAIISNAQLAIEWQKSLGGTSDDYAYSIKQTTDGGYIVAGSSYSNDGDVTDNHGNIDFWIVKLNSAGAIEWQKSLGGTGNEEATSIQQTIDGGYIIAGDSDSNDGDITGNHGGADYWIVKLNSAGAIEWQKSLGGSVYDEAKSIQQTTDGGYIVVGGAYSLDGDINGHHGTNDNENIDYWIVKLNRTGDIEWQKSLGGTADDYAYSITQTKDGGYIVAGESASNDGDLTGHQGSVLFTDYWVVKLTNAGVIEWQKSLGGTKNEYAYSIQQTQDGGYIVAGSSNSNDGDVTDNKGSDDYWIVKLTSSGTIQWQKCLGGTTYDASSAIQQTKDGGYIVAGLSNSNNGDVTGNNGYFDYWIVKLNSSGAIEGQKSLGGTADDEATSINQTKDGGYIIAGYSVSTDGDITGNQGSSDYWIVKLSPNVGINEAQANENSIDLYPNPANSLIVVSCPLIENKNANIRIYDLMGREQLTIKNAGKYTIDIDTGELKSGVYFVKLQTESGIAVKKFVKN